MTLVAMGMIHPVWAGWHLHAPVVITFPDGEWTIDIRSSTFHVFLDGHASDDSSTLRNDVLSTVQSCLDALGFQLATTLRAELTSIVADGPRLAMPTLGWPALAPPRTVDSVTPADLEPFLTAALVTPVVRLALADLRLAQEFPEDTFFYAFRAIESVRQWFLNGAEEDGRARSASWIDMRTTLSIDKDRLEWLTGMSKPRRHGSLRPTSEPERTDAILLAREVVQRFVTHIGPPDPRRPPT